MWHIGQQAWKTLTVSLHCFFKHQVTGLGCSEQYASDDPSGFVKPSAEAWYTFLGCLNSQWRIAIPMAIQTHVLRYSLDLLPSRLCLPTLHVSITLSVNWCTTGSIYPTTATWNLQVLSGPTVGESLDPHVEAVKAHQNAASNSSPDSSIKVEQEVKGWDLPESRPLHPSVIPEPDCQLQAGKRET